MGTVRHAKREAEAARAAVYIRGRFRECGRAPALQPIGLVLGTGWSKALKFAGAVEIPFNKIPGFGELAALEGHARCLVIGTLAGKNVFALRGRVHLNEAPCDPSVARMVRLQTEMLFQLGVRTLIVTSAVGSLRGALEVGQIAVIDGFVTLYAPEMPMYAGEFVSPDDTLDPVLRAIAHDAHGELVTKTVGHVMVRGPFFEGRKYDKGLLAKGFLTKESLAATGAGVVGMSMLPEACIAALYGARVLGLGFVTNDDVAEHSHAENQRRADEAAPYLCSFLERIVARLE